jgi:hypothetical protein
MSNIRVTIWILQSGAFVFGMAFFFFAFKASRAGAHKNQMEYVRSLKFMIKSALAFVAFLMMYLATTILSTLMGI